MRVPTLLSSSAGFTLVEVLVAFGILLIGLLGLLQSVDIAAEQNLKSQLRHGAALVAEEKLNEMKNRSFSSITTAGTQVLVPIALRGVNKSYNVVESSVDVGSGGSKVLQVYVGWVYKNISSRVIVKTAISSGKE